MPTGTKGTFTLAVLRLTSIHLMSCVRSYFPPFEPLHYSSPLKDSTQMQFNDKPDATRLIL